MKFGVRVAIGASVGLALAVGLTWWLGSWWIGAIAGGLLGPIVFLGTFFVWSADRPDEGYEQVLFDRPNTIVSGVLLLALAGLAFGTGFLGGSGLSPEEVAAMEQMETHRASLERLSSAYANASELVTKGEPAGDLATLHNETQGVRLALQALEVPETLSEAKKGLQKTAKALDVGFANLLNCVGGDTAACTEARFGAVDAQRGFAAYAEALPV